jgi:microcompartment protein CcmK/EutM
MFVGKVVGTVWSSVKWPGMTGHKLLLVRPYHLADLLAHPLRSGGDVDQRGTSSDPALCPPSHTAHEAVVCIDLLDAGVGDDVVVRHAVTQVHFTRDLHLCPILCPQHLPPPQWMRRWWQSSMAFT